MNNNSKIIQNKIGYLLNRKVVIGTSREHMCNYSVVK